MKGTVKWFNEGKGFGFIITDEGKEFFVHWKSIVTASELGRKTLIPDEEVEFDTIETDRGIQAINVIRVNP
ncbi:MAG: cold shock domain-containing protein [Candidatus Tenebribacter davisii]|jgi:CspA family cold shock protein|nr:cold shock domain-containing protein [Candidatus Tenebribacter davisii]